MADECRNLKEISGRARWEEPPPPNYNRKLPVDHDPETGEPTAAGWEKIEQTWGIRRDQ